MAASTMITALVLAVDAGANDHLSRVRGELSVACNLQDLDAEHAALPPAA
jgi:hypothetical protein